ncbi:MAG: DUF3800 domain-containing protein [Polyangiaceae bacterium]
MFLSYFDEPGDTGFTDSPSTCFVLAGVLVDEGDWLPLIDEMARFRGFLRDTFRIRFSDELKATNLVKCRGPFEHLAPAVAMRVYAMCLKFQAKCGKLRTFAIVIDKEKVLADHKDVRDIAWTYAIQRIERICTKGDGRTPPMKGFAMILPDEGHGDFLKRKIRRHRRHHLVPSGHEDGELLERPARNIIEDPFDRRSHESYFVQLADLNAFAAHRHVAPLKRFGPGMWDLLGDARIEQVNEITRARGGPQGP